MSVHHVEVITTDADKDWGYHCLTCGAQRDGLQCIEAAEDAADGHRLQSYLDVDLIRRAICDPGQFLPRGDDYTESIGSWGARAVVAALSGGLQ